MSALLADDEQVRRQPSFEDRKAVAATMLKDEHQKLADLKVRSQDLEESIKIIKMKYNDLKATNGDIRMQRQLIRDDKEIGGTVPEKRQDGSIPEGMKTVANKPKINPVDLFDANKRPDDMPEPRDMAHAKQIADFFNSQPQKVPEIPVERIEVTPTVSYADLI